MKASGETEQWQVNRKLKYLFTLFALKYMHNELYFFNKYN